MLSPHIPLLGCAGSPRCALAPLEGPRDHRVAPPPHSAIPPEQPSSPRRRGPDPAGRCCGGPVAIAASWLARHQAPGPPKPPATSSCVIPTGSPTPEPSFVTVPASSSTTSTGSSEAKVSRYCAPRFASQWPTPSLNAGSAPCAESSLTARSSGINACGCPAARTRCQPLPRRRDLRRLLCDRARPAPRARAAPPSLVPHQPHRPAERGKVHQLHRPLAIRPQRTATALTRRSRRRPADVHPQPLAGLALNAEHLHIAQSHQQLTDARRVALHRDPPDSRLPISTDSGGSLAFSRGPLPPPLRPQTRRAAIPGEVQQEPPRGVRARL